MMSISVPQEKWEPASKEQRLSTKALYCFTELQPLFSSDSFKSAADTESHGLICTQSSHKGVHKASTALVVAAGTRDGKGSVFTSSWCCELYPDLTYSRGLPPSDSHHQHWECHDRQIQPYRSPLTLCSQGPLNLWCAFLCSAHSSYGLTLWHGNLLLFQTHRNPWAELSNPFYLLREEKNKVSPGAYLSQSGHTQDGSSHRALTHAEGMKERGVAAAIGNKYIIFWPAAPPHPTPPHPSPKKGICWQTFCKKYHLKDLVIINIFRGNVFLF